MDKNAWAKTEEHKKKISEAIKIKYQDKDYKSRVEAGKLKLRNKVKLKKEAKIRKAINNILDKQRDNFEKKYTKNKWHNHNGCYN